MSIVFIAVFSAVSWFASPKGPNQTYDILPELRLVLCQANTRDITGS